MPREMTQKFNHPETAVKDDGRSIGLHNAFARMRMYYGESVSWDVSSILGVGTVITLKLPVQTHVSVEGEKEGDLL